MSLSVKVVKHLNKKVGFRHRDQMKKRGVTRSFNHPKLPTTVLPVDSTGNASVSAPMDLNDTLGDCGEAMAAHDFNIWTFGEGHPGWIEVSFALPALQSQYLAVSGGDNGLDEDMVVNQIMKVGVAGNKAMIIVDALDIDVTNVPLAQFAIDQFYWINMAWSVPDVFLDTFATGMVFSGAATPDPNNGHFVPLADIGGPETISGTTNLSGFYRLWTWGSWCWVDAAFVASVQPQCFICFSATQFSPTTGLDSKGRHITTQASLWVECGGNAIPASVINAFPPIVPPTPTPTPTPVPTPGPTDPRTTAIFDGPTGVNVNIDWVNQVIAAPTGFILIEGPSPTPPANPKKRR